MAGKRAVCLTVFIGLALIAVLLTEILTDNPTTPPVSERCEPPEPVKPAEQVLPTTNSKLLEVLGRIPDDEYLDAYPDEAYRKLVNMRDSGTWTGGPERVAEAKRLLAETTRHLTRLHEDETYRAHHMARTRVPLYPDYQKYELQAVSRPPYLLFFPGTKTTKGAAARAERLADILLGFDRTFRRLVGGAHELPRLVECRPPIVLKVVVFSDPGLFREYQNSIRHALRRDVVSLYSARDQFVKLTVGKRDETRSTVTDLEARRLIRVACQQVFHAYAKVTIEAETGLEVEWEDPRLLCRRFWLQNGFGELLSGGFSPGDETYDLARPLRPRLDEWREWMKSGEPDWPLAELLEIGPRPNLQRKCAARARKRGNMRLAARYRSLAIDQSWAFCHFLWNHENGKYRSKLLEALHDGLRGRSEPEDWARIWTGGEGKPDWDALETEWRVYVESLP